MTKAILKPLIFGKLGNLGFKLGGFKVLLLTQLLLRSLSWFNDLSFLLLGSTTGEDLADVTSDVGLVEKKGHLKRFYAGVEKRKAAKKCTAALDCTESVILKRLALI